MERLLKKFRTAESLVPAPQFRSADIETKIGAIYYGSTSAAMREAQDILAKHNVDIDLLRIRAFPFNDDVRNFIAAHDEVFVVEQNRDGQLRTMLINELEINPAKLKRAVHFDGSPITASNIIEKIAAHLPAAQLPAIRGAL